MSDSDFINPAQHNQDEVLFDSGGTCDCYRLVKDNRVYCVKRPKKDMRFSKAYMNLFRKEYELGIELEHPNIVRYLAYDEDESGPFIRMDYIDGDSLELLWHSILTISKIKDIGNNSATSCFRLCHIFTFWRLAEHQRDAIGQANDSISPTNDGWIDLFGYGTSGYEHGAIYYQPWSTFGVDSDYCAYGDLALDLNAETGQADWGYNAILNGGNREGLWRTLTGEEWEYVLVHRKTSSGVRYVKGRVDHFNGLILLPDDWNPETVSLHNVNQNDFPFGYNSIDSTRWNLMEASGAVFLPAAGSRWDNTYWASDQLGAYWASTKAYRLYFDDNTLSIGEVYGRTDGHAVRLVRNKE